MLELLTGRRSYDRFAILFKRIFCFIVILFSCIFPNKLFVLSKILGFTTMMYSNRQKKYLGHVLERSNSLLDGQLLSFMILMHYQGWSIPL